MEKPKTKALLDELFTPNSYLGLDEEKLNKFKKQAKKQAQLFNIDKVIIFKLGK